MPILPPRIPDSDEFLSSSRRIASTPDRNLGDDRRDKWKRLCERHGLEFIGSGREKLVFGFGNEKYAFALSHRFRRSPLEIAATWQLNKILNTLFPEIFPKMHAVHSIQEKSGTQALFIMQRIHGKPIRGHLLNNVTQRIETKLRRVFNLPIDQEKIVLDMIGDDNLIQDTTGKTYYIEVVSPRSSEWKAEWEYVDITMLLRQKEELEEHMRQENLPPHKRRIILAALSQLAQLTVAEGTADKRGLTE